MEKMTGPVVLLIDEGLDVVPWYSIIAPPIPKAVFHIRSVILGILRIRDVHQDVLEDIKLIVGELVGNCICHGTKAEIHLRITVADAAIRITIRQAGSLFTQADLNAIIELEKTRITQLLASNATLPCLDNHSGTGGETRFNNGYGLYTVNAILSERDPDNVITIVRDPISEEYVTQVCYPLPLPYLNSVLG